MAETTLLAESAHANPTSQKPYNAYRHAKAAWDVTLYSPEYENDDVPDAIEVPLCKAHSEALDRYLRAPANSVAELSRKLAVFRDEEAWTFTEAPIYVAALAEDARRLIP